MYYIFMIRAKLCILFRGCPILFEVYYIIKEVKMCGMSFSARADVVLPYNNLFGAERMVIACGNVA